MKTGQTIPSKTEARLLSCIELEPLAGRDVAKRYERDFGRSIGYGTIYIAFRKMEELGWVTHVDSNDKDGKLRTFTITEEGIVALSEAS